MHSLSWDTNQTLRQGVIYGYAMNERAYDFVMKYDEAVRSRARNGLLDMLQVFGVLVTPTLQLGDEYVRGCIWGLTIDDALQSVRLLTKDFLDRMPTIQPYTRVRNELDSILINNRHVDLIDPTEDNILRWDEIEPVRTLNTELLHRLQSLGIDIDD